jgi:hypothetical protein
MNKQKALTSGHFWLLMALVFWTGSSELSGACHESMSSRCPSDDIECSAKDPHRDIPLQALKNGQLVYSPPLPFCQITPQPLQGAVSGTISPGNYYPDLDQFFDIGWAANQSAPPINALYYNQIGICHLIHNHFREARLAFAKAIQTEQRLQLGLDGRIKSGKLLVENLNRLGACHNLTQLSENYSTNTKTNTTAKEQLEQTLSPSAVEPSCRLNGFRHNYEVAAHLEKQ